MVDGMGKGLTWVASATPSPRAVCSDSGKAADIGTAVAIGVSIVLMSSLSKLKLIPQ